MVPYHNTQYEENPSSHHRGMLEDGLNNIRLYFQTTIATSRKPLPVSCVCYPKCVVVPDCMTHIATGSQSLRFGQPLRFGHPQSQCILVDTVTLRLSWQWVRGWDAV